MRPFDEIVDLSNLFGHGHPVWETTESGEWIVRVGPYSGQAATRAGAEMRVIRLLRDRVIAEIQMAA